MSTVFPTNGAFFCTHGKLYFVWHRTCGTEFEWCWENIVCFHHLNQHQIISSSFCRWSLMSALPRQPCGCLYRLYIKQKTCMTTQNRHFRPSHFWYNSARVCSTQDGPDEQSSGSRAFCNHFLYGEWYKGSHQMPICWNFQVKRVVGSPDVFSVTYVKTYAGPCTICLIWAEVISPVWDDLSSWPRQGQARISITAEARPKIPSTHLKG